MNLYIFAQALAQAKSIKQAEALLQQYLLAAGFHCYAFTFYSGHIKTGRKLRYHCVSKALKPWHQHYLAQAYADVDRTLEEVYNETLPFFWDIQHQMKHVKNKREHRMRMESMAFGIDKGLSIPVHGPQHDFAILTLHQRQKENGLKNYSARQFEWLSAAIIYYHAIKMLLTQQKKTIDAFNLTKREEQCLLFTAKSWRVEQIAKKLKISPRTVNFHLQNINKKLGVNNKYQAVMKYYELHAMTS